MRIRVLTAASLAAFVSALHADGPKDNLPDNVRPIPPPGIEVPAKDAAEIGQGLRKLGAEVEALRRSLKSRPALLELLPDVEIFHKAVRYALEYNEFFKTNELAAAKALLKTAGERAQALREGNAPWTNATGLVVRGFRSRIDGSVQPYGLVVPESARTGLPSRLDIWFHGRGETLSEVNFLTDHQRNPGQFTPPNTIVLHVYNRYCNPARFAGETDVFEALEHTRTSYPVDENRVLVRGFSMGGASCWGFATHHAWRWAAAAPGAGFSETVEFLKVFQDETLRPTWWEKKLWRLYDATDCALNLCNVPTVAYSGEEDRQKQAADAMEKAMAKEGLRLTHLVGPKTGHKYEPATKAELERRIDAIADQGRNPVPARVKFTTFTLRYNRMFWVVVDGLEQHWERARCEAEFSLADNTIVATTKGVTALSFVFEPAQYPLDGLKRARLVVDGQRIEAPAAFSDRSFAVHLRKAGRTWKLALTSDDGSLAKRHGLQGPIDDAFMDSFIMVFPTGRPMNDQVGAWTATERGHAVEHWRRQFRGEPRIKDDHDVTPEDMASHHLILWGDPQRNEVIKRIADKLPIKWDEQGIRVGKESYNAGHHVPVMIHPNPLSPKRYVVINSGFTYREYDYLNNARQTPKLPDWAIIDISQPITSRAPGRVVTAGFFGEKWELKP
jgi:hypothetical protein